MSNPAKPASPAVGRSTDDTQTWAMFLLLSAIWGSSFLFIKAALGDGVPPLTLVSLRAVFGSLFLGLVHAGLGPAPATRPRGLGAPRLPRPGQHRGALHAHLVGPAVPPDRPRGGHQRHGAALHDRAGLARPSRRGHHASAPGWPGHRLLRRGPAGDAQAGRCRRRRGSAAGPAGHARGGRRHALLRHRRCLHAAAAQPTGDRAGRRWQPATAHAPGDGTGQQPRGRPGGDDAGGRARAASGGPPGRARERRGLAGRAVARGPGDRPRLPAPLPDPGALGADAGIAGDVRHPARGGDARLRRARRAAGTPRAGRRGAHHRRRRARQRLGRPAPALRPCGGSRSGAATGAAHRARNRRLRRSARAAGAAGLGHSMPDVSAGGPSPVRWLETRWQAPRQSRGAWPSHARDSAAGVGGPQEPHSAPCVRQWRRSTRRSGNTARLEPPPSRRSTASYGGRSHRADAGSTL